MGEMKITIPGELKDLNSYILEERSNKFRGARIKRRETAEVMYEARNMEEVGAYPVDVVIHWHCADRRKDPDNIAFAKKYILDGLVDAGVLKQDGWMQIRSFYDDFCVDRNFPRIEVVLSWD
jgi:hypothetical protein